MDNFCDKCGSLLRWDFSTGEKDRVCPRCGPIKKKGGANRSTSLAMKSSPTSDVYEKDGRSSTPNKKKFSVRKGVSPRNSPYAARSILRTNASSPDGAKMRSMKDWVSCNDNKGTPPDDWNDAGEMFPFPKIRPGQEDFRNDVKETIEKEGYLLANVPTGIGKTAASLSPALEHALKNDLMVLFMTSKQSQHPIAIDTVRRLSKRINRTIKTVDIVAKQSMCDRDIARLPHSTFSFLCKQQSKDGSCPLFRQPPTSLTREILQTINDVDRARDISLRQGICPHRAALEAAKEADLLICDFNYLFSDMKDRILSGLGRDLSEIIIIVDEAHNLPDRIRDHQSNELPMRILEEASHISSGGRHIKHYLTRMRDLIIRSAKEMGDEKEMELDKRMFVSEIRALFESGSIDGTLDLEMFIEMLETISKKRDSGQEEDPILMVAEFLDGLRCLKRSHLLYLNIPDGKNIDSLRLAYRNLDPGEISGPTFKGCHSAVLMSGTLAPPSMFGDILGMKKSRRTEREYPSPFPVRNKLVLIEKGITSAYRKRGPEMYRSMAERMVSVAGRVPGNVAAFFPSYSLLHDVKEYMWGCPKHLIEEERSMTRTDKEGIISRLSKAREGNGALLMAVMGGSLSEGVDYKDNLLSGIIIVGLPLAPPSLEVKALRTYYRSKFGFALGDDYSYNYPAVNRILQAAGRAIRSENDRSVIVFMEDRLKQPRYLKFLPGDLKPVMTEGMTMEQAISSFF